MGETKEGRHQLRRTEDENDEGSKGSNSEEPSSRPALVQNHYKHDSNSHHANHANGSSLINNGLCTDDSSTSMHNMGANGPNQAHAQHQHPQQHVLNSHQIMNYNAGSTPQQQANNLLFTHNLIPPTLTSAGIPMSQVQHTPMGTGNNPFAPNVAPQLFPAPQQVPPVMPAIVPPIPVYNGVNPSYPGLHVLNSSPPVFCVDNFLSPEECDFLIASSLDSFAPAPVVGKGAGEVSETRTSSTCYLAREDLPLYMNKIMALTGKPLDHCELPQIGRYLPSQKYLQHFDAFDLGDEHGRRFASNGGQRTVTVLVYLNDVINGGHTAFPSLNLEVTPRRGMAIVFFPATIDGYLDKMALHAALPAVDTKFVSQVWIRQGNYEGQPSKHLEYKMDNVGVQQMQQALASGVMVQNRLSTGLV
jgi:prolyl 4-hydroxylase